MVWKGFSDCVDEVYRRWLASTMVCCAPYARRRAAADSEKVEEEEEYRQQGRRPAWSDGECA